jgi:hypothetical protein
VNAVGTVPDRWHRTSPLLFPLRRSVLGVPGNGSPLPEGEAGVLLALWSPKGGAGTSVVAAALALVAAGGVPTRLADLGGDQAAILGLPAGASPEAEPSAPATGCDGLAGWLSFGPSAPTEWLDSMVLPVVPGLGLLPRGSGSVDTAASEAGAALAVALRDPGSTVVDAGRAASPAVHAVVEVADAAVMVIRPCYLALRRAVGHPGLERSAAVVLVEEAGRALDAGDVAAVLNRPVVGRFPVRAEVARAVDAGVLRDRLPAVLAAPARAVLEAITAGLGGRWAA